MERRIDLHIHTTASDGTDAPAEMVRRAAELGLAAVAVTDHDSVSGVAEAMRAGQALGIEVIPGIEVSADYKGNHAHIVGLFIDPAAEAMRPVIDWAVNERVLRNEKIVGAMEADGFDISLAALWEEYPASVLGRPHMAEHLMKKGYVSSVKEAFDRYLGEGCPYYRPRTRISIGETARCIRAAGGIAIVAHPMQYGYPEAERTEYIETCLAAGCAGFEAYYSEHSPEEQAYLLALAENMGVLVSGGSDYHGTRKPHIALGSGINGGLRIPYAVLETLREHLGARREEKRTIRLELSACASLGQIHDAIQKAFGFPAYYGKNLDALRDCLQDFAYSQEEPPAIEIGGVGQMPDELRAVVPKLLDVFRDVQRECPALRFTILS